MGKDKGKLSYAHQFSINRHISQLLKIFQLEEHKKVGGSHIRVVPLLF